VHEKKAKQLVVAQLQLFSTHWCHTFEPFKPFFLVITISIFIRKSPKRNDYIEDKLKALGKDALCYDVKTRWNSIITMIEAFIKVLFAGN
jgi:hypothetical protein